MNRGALGGKEADIDLASSRSRPADRPLRYRHRPGKGSAPVPGRPNRGVLSGHTGPPSVPARARAVRSQDDPDDARWFHLASPGPSSASPDALDFTHANTISSFAFFLATINRRASKDSWSIGISIYPIEAPAAGSASRVGTVWACTSLLLGEAAMIEAIRGEFAPLSGSLHRDQRQPYWDRRHVSFGLKKPIVEKILEVRQSTRIAWANRG